MSNRRTRYFLLGAAVVLVAGLCTGLVAYYGNLPSRLFARAAGPDELQYVPADAAVVAYANVRDVMDSDFRHRFKEVVDDHHGKGRDDFKEKTGIDIEKDVDSVTACVLTEDNGRPEGGYAVLRGRFDVDKLQALAVEHGGKVTDYKGRRMVVVTEKEGHRHRDRGTPENLDVEEGLAAEHRFAFSPVEPGVVIVGNDVAVKRGIDLIESGANVTNNAELMRLVAEVRDDANLWAVGRADVMTKGKGLPGEVTARIPSVKYFSAAGRVNGGISARVRAEARDDESAKNLREVVQGFAALARLQASSKQEWQPLIQSLQIGGEGTTVQVSFTLPTSMLDALTRDFKSQHQK